ncbi:beta-L-arabinofuranosidase domain-containing protein [Candidatus Sumerlaeota bacterium]
MSQSKLQELCFEPLSICDIEPSGWMKKQLRIQADGLTGHLDEFWPDVADSRWFGGETPDTERGPYWLDGLIPLAWQLDDEGLKAKARRCVGYMIEQQHEDGWIGPRGDDVTNLDRSRSNDAWTCALAAKVLAQYHDVTGDPKALEALLKFLKAVNEMLEVNPLFNWGYYRWFEILVGVYYAYERTGDDALLELARKAHEQGNDWPKTFAGHDITVPTPRQGRWKWYKHVVNIAMTIKGYPLWWRVSGDERDKNFVYTMMESLDRYHGQVTGVFSGDECLSGKDPLQGTELCAVADYMFSLAQAMSVIGDPAFGDRLERMTYNAWPATVSPDMWSHQYDQQANQAICATNERCMWGTNGTQASLFGLEPNFGCCTANMHQSWPKFVSHLWMKTKDDGIAAVALAPSIVKFESGDVAVEVELETEYPFRDRLKFVVRPESAVKFPLLIRIPQWADGPTVKIRGAELEAPKPGTFYTIDREWEGEVEIEVQLPMKPTATRRFNDAIALERGPLIYSLKIGEDWRRINEDMEHRELPHADWEVHPTTDWNYALDVDEKDVASSIAFEERPVGDCPFSPEGAPIVATVKGKQLKGWGLKNGWPAETPLSPVAPDGDLVELTFIPYGCTNLRMTEFPTLAYDSAAYERSLMSW